MKALLIFIVTTASIILSSSAYAKSEIKSGDVAFAQELVKQDLIRYGDFEYGLEDVLNIKHAGIRNGLIIFNVTYIKAFCHDGGDEERMACARYTCSSQADVNTSGKVNFKPESKREKCRKIPGSDFTEQY